MQGWQRHVLGLTNILTYIPALASAARLFPQVQGWDANAANPHRTSLAPPAASTSLSRGIAALVTPRPQLPAEQQKENHQSLPNPRFSLLLRRCKLESDFLHQILKRKAN